MNTQNNNVADLTYRPDFAGRRALGIFLLATLRRELGKGAGELLEQIQGEEIVLVYVAAPLVAIKVYTGCAYVDGVPVARNVGADAIRVAVVKREHANAPARGVFKTRRVNRTGKVGAIADRTMDRVRGAWKDARSLLG